MRSALKPWGARMGRRKMSDLVNASLERKTLEYWTLSRSARGHGKVITTGRAITLTTTLLEVLNPERRLWNHIAKMQNAIVDKGTCIQRSRQKAEVLSLVR